MRTALAEATQASTFNILQQEFEPVRRDFLESAGVKKLLTGTSTVERYTSLLRQIFHHTRENPQIQALATVYFRGKQRASIKRFFRHASSEIGHDQLALEDLKELGCDVSDLPLQNPLPETTALISFAFYQIHNLNPIGYLGYLFFLEFLPTGSGGSIMASLEAGGVPRAAMRFLHDHATIDMAHNKLMEGYASELISTARELQSVIYAMRATGRLYARMVDAAMDDAECPRDWGLSPEECEARDAPEWSESTGTRRITDVGIRTRDARPGTTR